MGWPAASLCSFRRAEDSPGVLETSVGLPGRWAPPCAEAPGPQGGELLLWPGRVPSPGVGDQPASPGLYGVTLRWCEERGMAPGLRTHFTACWCLPVTSAISEVRQQVADTWHLGELPGDPLRRQWGQLGVPGGGEQERRKELGWLTSRKPGHGGGGGDLWPNPAQP